MRELFQKAFRDLKGQLRQVVVCIIEQIIIRVGSIVPENPHRGCRGCIVLVEDFSNGEIFDLVDEIATLGIHGIAGIFKRATNHDD